MTDEIRAILDGPEMPVDCWCYKLQENLGFDHEACAVIEELRKVVKSFEERGLTFSSLPTPDLKARGPNSLRVSLGVIKRPVTVAFETGSLSDTARSEGKKLHWLCNEIRSLTGQDYLRVREPRC